MLPVPKLMTLLRIFAFPQQQIHTSQDPTTFSIMVFGYTLKMTHIKYFTAPNFDVDIDSTYLRLREIRLDIQVAYRRVLDIILEAAVVRQEAEPRDERPVLLKQWNRVQYRLIVEVNNTRIKF